MKTAVHHYLGTANNTYMQYLQGNMVRYKKYFYAIRPLLAARYIEENRCPAPILFEDLMKQELPENLRTEIAHVQKVKMVSDEKELHPQNPQIQKFIASELERQKEAVAGMMR